MKYVRYALELTPENIHELTIHVQPPLVNAHKYDPNESINELVPDLVQSFYATQMLTDVLCYPFAIWLVRSPVLRWYEVEPYLIRVLEIELARGEDWQLYEYERPYILVEEDGLQYKQRIVFADEDDDTMEGHWELDTPEDDES